MGFTLESINEFFVSWFEHCTWKQAQSLENKINVCKFCTTSSIHKSNETRLGNDTSDRSMNRLAKYISSSFLMSKIFNWDHEQKIICPSWFNESSKLTKVIWKQFLKNLFVRLSKITLWSWVTLEQKLISKHRSAKRTIIHKLISSKLLMRNKINVPENVNCIVKKKLKTKIWAFKVNDLIWFTIFNKLKHFLFGWWFMKILCWRKQRLRVVF